MKVVYLLFQPIFFTVFQALCWIICPAQNRLIGHSYSLVRETASRQENKSSFRLWQVPQMGKKHFQEERIPGSLL